MPRTYRPNEASLPSYSYLYDNCCHTLIPPVSSLSAELLGVGGCLTHPQLYSGQCSSEHFIGAQKMSAQQ